MLSKGVCFVFQLPSIWPLQVHAHLFPYLYRGYWRVVLEVGWLGLLVDR